MVITKLVMVPIFMLSKSTQISMKLLFNLHKNFRLRPLATTKIVFDVQLDLIILISSQEPPTSSTPPGNQKLFLGRSLAKLSLLKNMLQ